MPAAGLVAALTRAAGTVAGTVRTGIATVRQARETVEVAHRLVLRADRIVAELEGPLRAAAPGLTRLARTLDDPAVRDLPDTLRRVQREVLPVLRALANTHDRVDVLAGATDRVLSFADETGRTLAGLGLLGRRRPPARVLPDDRTSRAYSDSAGDPDTVVDGVVEPEDGRREG